MEMVSICRISALLLLLPAVPEAHSGDGDTGTERTLSCLSDIMYAGSSLTCKLVGGGGEDDEDDVADGISRMTACYSDMDLKKVHCVEGIGDTISFKDLSPVFKFNVTAHSKSGGQHTKKINLMKIVKPRSPQVWNVTFDHQSNLVCFQIRVPYQNDYLKVENQRFQLLIWNTSKTINISSDHVIRTISMDHLKTKSQYQVKVRAIPQKTDWMQGSWSEWSRVFSFSTPPEAKFQKLTKEKQEMYTLVVCLVLLLVVTSCVVLFWKKKIFSYMWPSIPHPKHTLVQICKPNKGLLLNVKPEVFSALTVYPMEKTEEQSSVEPQPSITAAKGEHSHDLSSTQSSDCSRSTTSGSTEELELSALLSRSSYDGEDSLQSDGPSIKELEDRPLTPPPGSSSRGDEVEMFGVGKQEEAYVTMSSFYQIK